MQAINEELDDLCSPANGLFAVPMGTLDITYNPAISGYDLTGVTASNVIAIQELRYKRPGPSHYWPKITKFDVSRDMAASEFASTMAIFLFPDDERSGAVAFPGLPIHVRYRQRFNHFANLPDDAQSVALLPAAANGIPALGAAIALMSGREVKRNFTEATTDPLQLDLVVPGAVLKSYQGLQLQRQTKIAAVAAQLLQQYGMPLRYV